ncbi:MAG: N-formylglutamate amidohydrolase [Bacilli bacterium]|nr:N-formylglutamate amidohydrolase [Bacilli bacterium]
MDIIDELNHLEQTDFDSDFIIGNGKIPILITAPHTMKQIKKDEIKQKEVYTKAIALYLHQLLDTYCLIKITDTGLDANRDNHDDFKNTLIYLIKAHNIKLVLDLHGARKERDFDVEFGTLNNLSADYSTIKELEKAFINNGLTNIKHNDPFKGGAITQYLYNIKDVDVIQLEINSNYRNLDKPNNIKKLCESLVDFIKEYSNFINL